MSKQIHDGFFDKIDKLSMGTKGLVFVGEEIIVYRRDDIDIPHRAELDLPGGGAERDEAPFKTFEREVYEEFGLVISEVSVVYDRRYESTLSAGRFGHFCVAKLDATEESNITFGDEGQEYFLMSVEDYLARDDAWPVFQDRTRDYLDFVGKASNK